MFLLDIDFKITLIENLDNLGYKYGEIYRLVFPSENMIIVSSQKLVNEICDETRFRKVLPKALDEIRSLAKDGLFTAYHDEPNWNKAHRILTPAFGTTSIRGMFPQMLDIAEQLMLKWERMGSDTAFDVSNDMTQLTLDTIALCAFNFRFNSFYSEEMHPFVDAMVGSLVEVGEKGRLLPIQDKLMYRARKRYNANNAYMRAVADELIQKRKKEGIENGPDDLLNKMLAGKDPVTGERLSDENISYQMITFLVAGHETTSGLLSFAVYYLCKNPDALKTAPGFAIEPLEDTILDGKYEIKKGDTFLVLSTLLHRDKSVWGEDAEAFRPERFAPENFEKLPPNAWKPFGNGTRACIGRAFAMQEAILVLTMLIQRFDFELIDPNYQLKIQESLTIKPEGLYVYAKRNGIHIQGANNTSQNTAATTPTELASSDAQAQVLILYGSNMGTARSFATELLQGAIQKGFTAKIGELDNYVNQIPKDSKVIIVTVSYEGKPPNNAVKFVTWLEENSSLDLKGIDYCVFGCGNRDWVNTYQAVPTYTDERLAALGAKRIYPKGEADAKVDFLTDFENWATGLWQTLETSLERFELSNNEQAALQMEMYRKPIKLEHLGHKKLEKGQVIARKELVNMSHSLGRQTVQKPSKIKD